MSERGGCLTIATQSRQRLHVPVVQPIAELQKMLQEKIVYINSGSVAVLVAIRV